MSQETIETVYKERRRGCLIRIIGGWLVFGALLLAGLLYIRSKVDRDPAQISAYMATRFEMNLPERFQPYSRNNFMGSLVISYWDKKNVREDGRTLTLLSFYREDDWKNKSAAELEKELSPDLEDKLTKNQFIPKDIKTRTLETLYGQISIHTYQGSSVLDKEQVSAISCFRFLDTPEGAFQVQTLGVATYFPLEEQIELLSSIRPKNP